MSEADGTLAWLQAWYRGHCNSEWEHGYGVHIGTLDNPGWSVDIDLRDTELEGLSADLVKIERSDDDWVHYRVHDRKLIGCGGPGNLTEILEAFRRIVTEHTGPTQGLVSPAAPTPPSP